MRTLRSSAPLLAPQPCSTHKKYHYCGGCLAVKTLSAAVRPRYNQHVKGTRVTCIEELGAARQYSEGLCLGVQQQRVEVGQIMVLARNLIADKPVMLQAAQRACDASCERE
jgi:hypothetical protein